MYANGINSILACTILGITLFFMYENVEYQVFSFISYCKRMKELYDLHKISHYVLYCSERDVICKPMYLSAVSSLSSKLASRAKHFVEETPEKPLSQRTPHFANRGSTVDLTSSPVKVILFSITFLIHVQAKYAEHFKIPEYL